MSYIPLYFRSDDQWLNALKKCRSSGLTDRTWCDMNGIHPTSFYRAIRRLRKKACAIPTPSRRALSLPQQVVEVASVDENGIITQPRQTESVSVLRQNHSPSPYNEPPEDPIFVASACIVAPSGIKVELSNNTNAVTIRNIVGVLHLCCLKKIKLYLKDSAVVYPRRKQSSIYGIYFASSDKVSPLYPCIEKCLNCL